MMSNVFHESLKDPYWGQKNVVKWLISRGSKVSAGLGDTILKKVMIESKEIE